MEKSELRNQTLKRLFPTSSDVSFSFRRMNEKGQSQNVCGMKRKHGGEEGQQNTVPNSLNVNAILFWLFGHPLSKSESVLHSPIVHPSNWLRKKNTPKRKGSLTCMVSVSDDTNKSKIGRRKDDGRGRESEEMLKQTAQAKPDSSES